MTIGRPRMEEPAVGTKRAQLLELLPPGEAVMMNDIITVMEIPRARIKKMFENLLDYYGYDIANIGADIYCLRGKFNKGDYVSYM